MFHKKVKTEPCISPESPFMRKPSKEYLQKLTFNRLKQKQNESNVLQSSEYFGQQNISKISFIPSGSVSNLHASKNDTVKLKKTTIELGTFKIKHENMVLKTQMQDIRRKNSQLMEQNESLRKQNQDLKKEIELYGQSRISKFSQETLQHTDYDESKRRNNLIRFGSQQSLLEIPSYQILPTTIQLSKVSSLIFDEELKENSQCNFLSSSIGRKSKLQNPQPKASIKKEIQYKHEIQSLQTRISCLQKQLHNSLLRQRELEKQNQSLRLCASMSKRKLQIKDSQLKEMRIKEKKKKYSETFFDLSSEEDNQFC